MMFFFVFACLTGLSSLCCLNVWHIEIPGFGSFPVPNTKTLGLTCWVSDLHTSFHESTYWGSGIITKCHWRPSSRAEWTSPMKHKNAIHIRAYGGPHWCVNPVRPITQSSYIQLEIGWWNSMEEKIQQFSLSLFAFSFPSSVPATKSKGDLRISWSIPQKFRSHSSYWEPQKHCCMHTYTLTRE